MVYILLGWFMFVGLIYEFMKAIFDAYRVGMSAMELPRVAPSTSNEIQRKDNADHHESRSSIVRS